MSSGSLVTKFTPCGFCSQVFQRKQDFYEHNNNEHSDIICEIWESCPRCNKYYPNRMALNKHKSRHKNKAEKNNVTHALADTSEGSEHCQFCQRSFGKRSQYYTHVNKDHLDLVLNSWAKCDRCEKFFPTKRIRNRHKVGFKKRGESCWPKRQQDFEYFEDAVDENESMDVEEESSLGGPHFLAFDEDIRLSKTKEAIGAPSCLFCGLQVDSKDEFYEHANSVHFEIVSVSWVACVKCFKYYPTRQTLMSHMEGHHENGTSDHLDESSLQDQSPIDEQDVFETNNGSLTCRFCKLVLTRKQDLYEHANREHLAEISLVWKKCKDCDRHYPSRKALNNHEDSHRKKSAMGEDELSSRGQSCEFCELYFSRRDQYYKHVNEDHRSDVEHIWISCFDCNRFFPTKRIRDRHRERFRKRKESCVPKYAYSEDYDEEVEGGESSPSQFEHLNDQPSLVGANVKEIINCEFCELVLTRLQDYYEHANKEHSSELGSIWFGCKLCQKFYPNRKSLINHEEKSHRKKELSYEASHLRTEPCMFCSEMFAKRDEVYRHANFEHFFRIKDTWKKCPDCNRFFPTSRVRDSHKEKCKSEDDLIVLSEPANFAQASTGGSSSEKPVLTCQYCLILMHREQDYYEHANKKHADQIESVWLRCTHCSKYYPTKKTLYKHMRICSKTSTPPVKKEGCEFCSESFSRKILYYDHVNFVHKAEAAKTWVPCDQCFKYFPMKWVLELHKEGFRQRGETCSPQVKSDTLEDLHENKNGSNEVEDEAVNESDGEYYDCDFCDVSFSIESEYHDHANEAHLDQVENDWAECSSCKKFFPTLEACKLHQIAEGCKVDLKNKVLKPPSVTITRLAPSKTELPLPPPLKLKPPSLLLQSHLMGLNRMQVQRQGKLTCTFCLQVFGKEQHYYRHVNDTHYDEAILVWATCDGCNKLFPSKDIMDRHKKKAQLRGMPCNPDNFKNCEICSMTFVRKEAYYKHANDVHRDVICYTWSACNDCGRYYPSKAILNSHKLWYKSVSRSCKKVIAGGDLVENEICAFCMASFPVGSGFLKHHLDKIHGVSPVNHIHPNDLVAVDYADGEDWPEDVEDPEDDEMVEAKIKGDPHMDGDCQEVETFEDSFMSDVKAET